MSKTIIRNTELPTFFGKVQLKGIRAHDNINSNSLSLFYRHPNGQLWNGDSIQWLRTLPSESIDLVFADPPYNIKKRIGTALKVRKPTSNSQFNGLNKLRGF